MPTFQTEFLTAFFNSQSWERPGPRWTAVVTCTSFICFVPHDSTWDLVSHHAALNNSLRTLSFAFVAYKHPPDLRSIAHCLIGISDSADSIFSFHACSYPKFCARFVYSSASWEWPGIWRSALHFLDRPFAWRAFQETNRSWLFMFEFRF